MLKAHFSPVTLLALLLNVLIFAAVLWIATSATRRDIRFTEAEMRGLENHQHLMQQLTHAPSLALLNDMRRIADQSNLILDPELGSYYLMNIVIRIAPEMLVISREATPEQQAFLLQDLIARSERSLQITRSAGIDIGGLPRAVADLRTQQGAPQAVYTLYQRAAGLLEQRLMQRLARDRKHLARLTLTILALFVFASILLVVAVTYYLRQREYRAAQEKLQLMEKLESVNAELEHFAYYTAHDLKEPIRTLNCFASLLSDSAFASDSTEQQRYLETIQQSARRMEQLVNGVLATLNLQAEAAISTEPVALDLLLHDVLNDLHQLLTETGATIHAENLPTISTYPVMLRRVLQNIVQNALRYHRPGIAPLIHVTATQKPEGVTLCVKDNGSGFDMAYADKALQPFTRLHDEQQPAGSGLGLHICRKLMQQLGGEIALSSRPGHGTNVRLWLPNS